PDECLSQDARLGQSDPACRNAAARGLETKLLAALLGGLGLGRLAWPLLQQIVVTRHDILLVQLRTSLTPIRTRSATAAQPATAATSASANGIANQMDARNSRPNTTAAPESQNASRTSAHTERLRNSGLRPLPGSGPRVGKLLIGRGPAAA